MSGEIPQETVVPKETFAERMRRCKEAARQKRAAKAERLRKALEKRRRRGQPLPEENCNPVEELQVIQLVSSETPAEVPSEPVADGNA